VRDGKVVLSFDSHRTERPSLCLCLCLCLYLCLCLCLSRSVCLCLCIFVVCVSLVVSFCCQFELDEAANLEEAQQEQRRIDEQVEAEVGVQSWDSSLVQECSTGFESQSVPSSAVHLSVYVFRNPHSVCGSARSFVCA
jgi:hypothetical protein